MSSAPTQPIAPRPLPAEELPPQPAQEAPAARRGVPLPQPALTGRGWATVIVVVLAFVAAAVVVGLTRTPTYSAESDMNVGAVNLRVQAQSGYTAGAEALASSYSRVVMSDVVVRPVARELSLAPDVVKKRLSATPVPDEPQFRIIAKGPTSADAIALADAATRQMQTYSEQATTGKGPDSAAALLKRYQRQSARAVKLRDRFFLLNGLVTQSKVQGATPEEIAAAPPKWKVRQADIAYRIASLRAQASGIVYQQRIQETGDAPRVALLGRSTDAKSDRVKVLEDLVAVAVLAGLLVGVALGLGIDRVSGRRRRTATA
jgi:capsular polysaccharide biosynthesis protein